ncbi:peptidoglycan-binding protein [Marinobacter salinisoli]|uniref:Peptidoglycan-binding protein n=1 Tax=Marinobacter salinisoli TaxID=2769486 RepID=A0ABX7MP36_9GAMM|nr:peptidoglycan-binding domain-containing protein [Marinobacter salinisoli]QSP93938.1 peptidoglycan-binding protein [Marinobacter salinisoli]
MGCFSSGMFRNGIVFSLAISASAIAQGNNVKLIFAAENALYGAGYDIGQADGWMDDALRAAVKRYQGQSPGLTATGTLDAQTLKSLGVSAGSDKKVSGNDVASPEAALAELGLTKTKTRSSKQVRTESRPVARTKDQPKAKKPEVAVKPEPKAVPEPITKAVKVAETKPDPEKPVKAVAKPAQPKPQVVTKAETKLPAPAPQPEPVVAVPKPATAPSTAAAQQIAVANPGQPDAADESDGVATKSRYELKADGTQSSLEKLGVITGNPVAPSADATTTAETTDANGPEEDQAGASGGSGVSNFFSNLFDFLFGWIV